MKIALGSDPFGFDLKEGVKHHLLAQGHEIIDLGTLDKAQPVLFVEASSCVAKAVQAGQAERGIVFCGTGMGVSIVANKHKGIYCAVVESTFAARECREINNANMLALGGRIFGQSLANEVVDTFLTTEWMQACNGDDARKGRLQKFYDMMQAVEAEQFNG